MYSLIGALLGQFTDASIDRFLEKKKHGWPIQSQDAGCNSFLFSLFFFSFFSLSFLCLFFFFSFLFFFFSFSFLFLSFFFSLSFSLLLSPSLSFSLLLSLLSLSRSLSLSFSLLLLSLFISLFVLLFLFLFLFIVLVLFPFLFLFLVLFLFVFFFLSYAFLSLPSSFFPSSFPLLSLSLFLSFSLSLFLSFSLSLFLSFSLSIFLSLSLVNSLKHNDHLFSRLSLSLSELTALTYPVCARVRGNGAFVIGELLAPCRNMFSRCTCSDLVPLGAGNRDMVLCCLLFVWVSVASVVVSVSRPQALPDQQRSRPCSRVCRWFPNSTFLVSLCSLAMAAAALRKSQKSAPSASSSWPTNMSSAVPSSVATPARVPQILNPMLVSGRAVGLYQH